MNIITVLTFLNKWKKFLIPVVLLGIISFQQITIKNLKLQNLQLGAKTKEVVKWKTKEVIKTVTETKYIDRKVFALEDEKITKLPDGTQITEIHRDIKSEDKKEVITNSKTESNEESKEVTTEKPVIIPLSTTRIFNLATEYNLKEKSFILGSGINIGNISATLYFFEIQKFKADLYSINFLYKF